MSADELRGIRTVGRDLPPLLSRMGKCAADELSGHAAPAQRFGNVRVVDDQVVTIEVVGQKCHLVSDLPRKAPNGLIMHDRRQRRLRTPGMASSLREFMRLAAPGQNLPEAH